MNGEEKFLNVSAVFRTSGWFLSTPIERASTFESKGFLPLTQIFYSFWTPSTYSPSTFQSSFFIFINNSLLVYGLYSFSLLFLLANLIWNKCWVIEDCCWDCILFYGRFERWIFLPNEYLIKQLRVKLCCFW